MRLAPSGNLAPERLSALRRVATIESIGSSTRIEGSRLSDREVERLLSNLEIKSFATRDEQEVAGYAELMDLAFSSWRDIPFSENHTKRLHQILLRYSEKDIWHRSKYKTHPNSVAAFDEAGAQIGIVFQSGIEARRDFMDTDDLSEKSWALIVLAASVSDTLKAELSALAGRFRSEDEWLRGVRAHMERIGENPEGYVDYWDLENEEGVTPDRMARCAADLCRRVDEILLLPMNRRGVRA